ncbi:MAG: patatin-like phospholipase family protein [Desulfovermiculus sp.]|nr:patatin-like phospholipase family protein [Desulfovermiculus sp.]
MTYISRRLFLGLGAAAAGGLAWGVPWAWSGKNKSIETIQEIKMEKKPSIGLALGAGGANGLAHILMLEVFDELGLVPDAIAGCSIGSIMGALFASGKSSSEIKAMVDELVVRKDDTWKDVFLRKDLLQWVQFLDPELGRGGFISGDAFLDFLYEHIQMDTFEDLAIPLCVVATDFWEREAVVYDSGPLLSAIQASMALPGLFTPVRRDGRILIDGGAVNPVPYDTLIESCQVTVAVDVTGQRSPKKDLSFLDTIFNTFQIMQHSIVREKYAKHPPDIVITPDIVDVRALDFHRVDTIFKQAKPAKDKLKRELEALFV